VPYPLGATYDGRGVNFAVFSENATAVDLCLFDEQQPKVELQRHRLQDVTQHVWHGYLPGLKPGALYGFRAHGPWEPARGLRFNANKVLTDPYARAFSGKPDWMHPLTTLKADENGVEPFDARDSSAGAPRCVVVHDDFDWGDERRPSVVWRRAVLYELHVKGFTARHPQIPPELKGRYLGLAHPAAIEHLVSLGVTSVELLPVHECSDEGFLLSRGLSNYWGYNTLGFFAPDQRYASGSRGQQVREFKQMVKALHGAGLEVILDVVYNHSCEGNELGPMLCFRGLDNPTYYWLEAKNRARYRDFTGCGNSLNLPHPQVMKLVLDSLRHWVTEFHVDGFRFDLAPELARVGEGSFSSDAAFLQAVHQDPVLSRVKLIAEPWDVGEGGYRLGQFPGGWAEWNDRFRETMRRAWRGDERQAAEIGYRLTGSSDLFKSSGRRPMASINFVTCHDGFTLHDLVTYQHKHNELNGEDNRDGASENHAWNCGHEGETDDPVVNALRDRQKRNLLAALMLSVGTPMLNMGDELGRTQWGNNNAYCQDNELSWVDWNLTDRKRALLDFTRKLIRLRHSQPTLQRRNFFLGSTLEDSRFADLVWFRPDGAQMTAEDWQAAGTRCLGWFLGGDAIATREPTGAKVLGDTLLVFMNAYSESVTLTLPERRWGESWETLLETARDASQVQRLQAGARFDLAGHAVVVFRLVG
jgi:glycogen operon protein